MSVFKTHQEAAQFRLKRKKLIKAFEQRYGEPQTWKSDLGRIQAVDKELGHDYPRSINDREVVQYIQALRDLYLHYRGDRA